MYLLLLRIYSMSTCNTMVYLQWIYSQSYICNRNKHGSRQCRNYQTIISLSTSKEHISYIVNHDHEMFWLMFAIHLECKVPLLFCCELIGFAASRFRYKDGMDLQRYLEYCFSRVFASDFWNRSTCGLKGRYPKDWSCAYVLPHPWRQSQTNPPIAIPVHRTIQVTVRVIMVGLPSISTKLWDGQIHSKRQWFVHQALLQPLNPESTKRCKTPPRKHVGDKWHSQISPNFKKPKSKSSCQKPLAPSKAREVWFHKSASPTVAYPGQGSLWSALWVSWSIHQSNQCLLQNPCP